MRSKTRFLVHSAVIAALYIVLTCMQYILFPESTSMAIQFRVSEALCVLAFFTKAAIPGLTIGCLLFNLCSAQTLPLDFLFGSLATFCAAVCMWRCRRLTVFGYPLPGSLMPALWNALFVGAELSWYIGGGFALNAACVGAGEACVLLTLGSVLYAAVRTHRKHLKL